MARWKQTAQAQNWPMPRLRGKGGGTGGREERDERIRGGCRTTMHCMYARHILSVADRPHYQLTQRRRRILSDIADDASLHTLPVELARLAPRCALLLKFVELVRVVLRSLNLLLQNYCACARLREAALFHRPILGSSCWRRRAGAAAHAMIDRYSTNPPSVPPSLQLLPSAADGQSATICLATWLQKAAWLAGCAYALSRANIRSQLSCHSPEYRAALHCCTQEEHL